MKKRALSLFLALALCLGMLPMGAFALEDNSNDFIIENGVLVKYVGSGGIVKVPDTVTAIGDRAFAGCTNIDRIDIPSNTMPIGKNVFDGCKESLLISVYQGPHYVMIKHNDMLFGDLGFLVTDLVQSSTTRGYFVVDGSTLCAYFGEGGDLVVPAGIDTIGRYTLSAGDTYFQELSVFYNRNDITGIEIPSSVTSIDSALFNGCDGLKSIEIPENVTILRLVDETLQSGKSTINFGGWNFYGDVVVSGYPHLERIKLPSRYASIHYELHEKGITHFAIPEGATSFSLNGMSDLVSLKIPDTVKRGMSFQSFTKYIGGEWKLETIENNPNRTLDNHISANLAIRDSWDLDRDLEPQSQRITDLSNQIVAGCGTNYEKTKAIAQWVVDNIEYDYDYYYAHLKDYSEVPFEPEDVLDAGMAVCAGYSRLTQALLTAQNIPCLYVVGWAHEDHAWNLAYVDGDYIWMDNTWGMDYFDRGTANFSIEHVGAGAIFYSSARKLREVENKLDVSVAQELNQELGIEITTGTTDTEEKPTAPTAVESTQTVKVDGKAVDFYAYALVNENGGITNYVKLRDVAALLSGTKGQFEVGWNGSINLETGKSYTKVGGELEKTFQGDQPYVLGDSPVNVNGAPADLKAITLMDANGGNYNYFELRKLGQALGFNVGWSKEKGIFIETDKPYDPNN